MLNESHILLQQYHNFLGFKNQIDRLSKHHLNPFLSLLLRRTMIEYTDGYVVFFFWGGGRRMFVGITVDRGWRAALGDDIFACLGTDFSFCY